MKAVLKRVRRLEEHFTPVEPEFLNPENRERMVTSLLTHKLRLENSKCLRYVTESGNLHEVVDLDGIRGNLSKEELDHFVAAFPIRLPDSFIRGRRDQAKSSSASGTNLISVTMENHRTYKENQEWLARQFVDNGNRTDDSTVFIDKNGNIVDPSELRFPKTAGARRSSR